MGDSYYPIGQKIPSGTFGAYASRSSRPAVSQTNASFQAVLSQQQQQPFLGRSDSPIASNSTPIASALPPQFTEETLALMQNMPHRLNPAQAHDKILQNYQEYQQMKAAKSDAPPQTTEPQVMASGNAAAFNAALGQSFSSAPIESSPLPAEPVYSQPVQQSQLEPVIEPMQTNNPLLAPQPTTNSRSLWSDDSAHGVQTQSKAPATPASSKGIGESFFGFFKNVASFATLGFYRPNNEPAPTGMMRAAYPFKKLLWDAPKSLIVDTPTSIANRISDSMSAKQPDQPQLAQPTEPSSRPSRRFASSKPWMHARV